MRLRNEVSTAARIWKFQKHEGNCRYRPGFSRICSSEICSLREKMWYETKNEDLNSTKDHKLVDIKLFLQLKKLLYYFIVPATFTGVKTLEWPWFCHRREHFFINYSKWSWKLTISTWYRSWWDIKMLAWSSTSLLPFTRSSAVANIECSQFCV